MARLFGRKNAKLQAEADERARTSEWLDEVISATGEAALVQQPLKHAPTIQLLETAAPGALPASARHMVDAGAR
jgi:hypothetical protein